ncbi:GNAT family N-acetyltransferase [Facklamia hominis]|uniref:GNAT family N-acetyltransferase n=1 Tax=Facklamia hominis TaxID=178214 RepID=A0AAJ1Q715_9LACT|nr:GNAT family N-acetyltransferase [Facklamia hominis]EPH09790.1 hypothetical protein HMPREF9260_01238 [Facklamia hominis ACS-120-V-Sch10]MDK7188072.1 GNAT family N-acetyltransferase [Facklamia hominis]WPJ90506.1 GNAT family N-acetyltransferase [Facklamia hominis]
MNIYRVDKVWQLALVYEVRRKTLLFGKKVSSHLEFDETYGKEYNYLLIEENDKGIGTLRVNLENEDYGKIERVSIIPECQSKGLGGKILEEAEKWILESGRNKVVVHSFAPAVNFYLKYGYKLDESKIIDSEIPQKYMYKNLEG